MKALIVYESSYGNTRQIAEAVAEGIRAAGPPSGQPSTRGCRCSASPVMPLPESRRRSGVS